MKMLLIGIDGGDAEVFKHFDMPFYNKLLAANKSVTLTEDLHSRGWIEILTGNVARDNMGFYCYPCLSGTHNFVYDYSFNDLKKTTPNLFYGT